MSVDMLFIIGALVALSLLVMEFRRINRHYSKTHTSIAKELLGYLGASSLAVIVYLVYAFAVTLFFQR